MAAPMLKCVCHVLQSKNEPIVKVSDISWQKLCDCVNLWIGLDGKEKDLAQEFDFTARECAGYHRGCYQKFTDKKRIEQAQKRKEKGCLKYSEATSDRPLELPSCKEPRVLLRSSVSVDPSVPRRSKYVLQEECIICQHSKFTVQKPSMKRVAEKLITCETNAEKLKKAAELKGDRRILLQVSNHDPVCIEVRYHASCYKHYTKCVYTKTQAQERPLAISFNKFCVDFIQNRVLKGEVFQMKFLTNQFIKYVLEKKSIDITGYRNDQLKARLIKRYPDLNYFQPDSKSSEFVLHSMNEDEAFVIQQDNTITESDSECEELEFLNLSLENSSNEEVAQLYRASMIIRAVIKSSSGLSTWPPGADDVSMDQCLKSVPPLLFNFLSWACGLSEEFCETAVTIQGDDNQKKLLSIAQDLIVLASQGRKLMPKHLALGMTVRHLTGSAKLQQLLNSFGHCVSHSVTLEHDTALANKQLQSKTDVPPGFSRDVFTTLVWDNNDFGEETLSGRGTTHNTNGIIIQRALAEVSHRTPEIFQRRDRKGTIDAPSTVIKPYHGQKRKGPVQFQGWNPNLDRMLDVQKLPKLLDKGLLLARFCQDHSDIPGWSGFNHILTKDYFPVSMIGYLPGIDASPTEKSTVNAILEKSLDIADSLGLATVVLVMDQAIYAKAQEIRWQGLP